MTFWHFFFFFTFFNLKKSVKLTEKSLIKFKNKGGFKNNNFSIIHLRWINTTFFIFFLTTGKDTSNKFGTPLCTSLPPKYAKRIFIFEYMKKPCALQHRLIGNHGNRGHKYHINKASFTILLSSFWRLSFPICPLHCFLQSNRTR